MLDRYVGFVEDIMLYLAGKSKKYKAFECETSSWQNYTTAPVTGMRSIYTARFFFISLPNPLLLVREGIIPI